MSKSTRGFGFGRGSGTVPVIELKVQRSSARNARLAFIITVVVVGLAAMAIASDYMHPILAALLAAPIAAVAGLLVWLLVRAWPVLRLLWWWSFEIAAGIGLTYGWVALANATTAAVTLTVLALLVGVPAVVPPIRRPVVAVAWCFIVRHRLRLCFAQFIIANKSGSLPLILWARPTPVGERVWVYLRPGLALDKLQPRLGEIAVTCHADSVLIERASDRTAAFLRFDIKRREVLTADVTSPLPSLVPTGIQTPAGRPTAVPTALDLPDVPDDTASLATAAKSATGPNGKKPATGKPGPAAADSDDLNDWI